ncbi:MAG: 50S ribosomal protein L6 [Gammaproteobacteria bacterium]|nr:MAG: 50S ribosomal protein L6 [Gammaproteobacteria bacterium]
MSRVSSNPIRVPSNVEIRIVEDDIHIKGPLGTLQFSIADNLLFDLSESILRIKVKSESQQANAISGTTRAIVANMIYGVSIGFEKKLQLVGVGYRAQATADKLNLTLGFSHPIDFEIPGGIKIETPTQTEIIIKGIDKQKVGQVAADIRAYRKPEPYKGKGIRYSDEVIALKETKKK